MECELFRKRLNDLLQDNLSYDIKKAMEKHMEECEACRNIYENEKMTDKMLYDYMQSEDIDFSNIRPNIMNNINKGRYNSSLSNKLFYAFKKHGKKYVASAALIAFLTVSIVQIFHGVGFFPLGTDNARMETTGSAGSKSLTDSNYAKSNPYVTETDAVLPKFIKQPAAAGSITPDSDHSKKSPDGNILAVVTGKGENVQEEGIADILLIYKNNEESLIKLTDNSAQLTPKFVEWKDNNNLYVIVGYGYGTVTTGGDLYLLNIDTLDIKPLYIGEKCRREVKSIKIMDEGLQLYVNLYDKDALHYETQTVMLKYSQMQ